MKTFFPLLLIGEYKAPFQKERLSLEHLGGNTMHFTETGFEEIKVDLNRLDDIMESHGLVRAGQWDYERVTYDRKFEIREGIFYLRLQGLAVEGDVGKHDAVIQLMTPLLGKHYYPHGVEYGEGETFPKHLITSCEKLLNDVKKEAAEFAW